MVRKHRCSRGNSQREFPAGSGRVRETGELSSVHGGISVSTSPLPLNVGVRGKPPTSDAPEICSTHPPQAAVQEN
eukprot:5306975-Pyramimonas_sp.AAC.1